MAQRTRVLRRTDERSCYVYLRQRGCVFTWVHWLVILSARNHKNYQLDPFVIDSEANRLAWNGLLPQTKAMPCTKTVNVQHVAVLRSREILPVSGSRLVTERVPGRSFSHQPYYCALTALIAVSGLSLSFPKANDAAAHYTISQVKLPVENEMSYENSISSVSSITNVITSKRNLQFWSKLSDDSSGTFHILWQVLKLSSFLFTHLFQLETDMHTIRFCSFVNR